MQLPATGTFYRVAGYMYESDSSQRHLDIQSDLQLKYNMFVISLRHPLGPPVEIQHVWY